MATLSDADKAWQTYTEQFLSRYFKLYPDGAMSAGSHDYDSILALPGQESREKQTAFLKEELSKLEAYPMEGLSASALMDIKILKNEMAQGLFYLTEFKAWAWNPAQYNATAAFSEILANPKIPRRKKMRDLAHRLRKVPLYYKMAMVSIDKPTREHNALAIAQNKGGAAIFKQELRDSLRKAGLSAVELQRALNDCVLASQAVDEYVAFLERKEDVGQTSFRIGPELYKKAFSYVIQTGVSPQEAYDAAFERKAFLHRKMFEIAQQLGEKSPSNPSITQMTSSSESQMDTLALIKSAIDRISMKHCRADSFQDAIRNQIPKLSAFVRYKKLLYLDPSKPLVVRKEPDYMAGVAGASISAPGPLEKGGNTYYNVGSLAGMNSEEKESYLREYNNYILQILNIHEAIPGHYAQLVYANKNPSLVKSIFGNGAMIEGWAVYSELMMLENGYGGNTPEMWLMYYKWNLRTVCNTILDYSVHNLNMDEKVAMDLLQRQAFQTEAEAKGKWKRATLTSVQLCSYFTGFDAIMRLRDDSKLVMGPGFDLKAFHEQFLSYGSAPVALIAADMVPAEKVEAIRAEKMRLDRELQLKSGKSEASEKKEKEKK